MLLARHWLGHARAKMPPTIALQKTRPSNRVLMKFSFGASQMGDSWNHRQRKSEAGTLCDAPFVTVPASVEPGKAGWGTRRRTTGRASPRISNRDFPVLNLFCFGVCHRTFSGEQEVSGKD